VNGVRMLDAAKAAALLFLAAIVQVSIFNPDVSILGGTPNLLLVTLVAVSLLRGAIAGTIGGFFAGLVVDSATLDVLGFTSLLLTVSGYWIGRYGETTGRDRSHAPFVSVAVVTFLYALGGLVLHFMLGTRSPAGAVLVDVWPTIVLNLILTAPVYAIVRRLLRPLEWGERATEVQLLG
jgi:rod shape-determining protein MreD